MSKIYDLFISHAGPDKHLYILPIADALKLRHVSFWIDSVNVAWGDNITERINEGLRDARYVLLCLSSAFLKRRWPEAELTAALAIQNRTGRKTVLPLILNSKEAILNYYPLLASSSYRTFDNIDQITEELVGILACPSMILDDINMVIDSEASRKLVTLTHNYGLYADVINYLSQMLLIKVDPSERYWLYITLGEIGGQAAYELIKASSEGENDFAILGVNQALLKLGRGK